MIQEMEALKASRAGNRGRSDSHNRSAPPSATRRGNSRTVRRQGSAMRSIVEEDNGRAPRGLAARGLAGLRRQESMMDPNEV